MSIESYKALLLSFGVLVIVGTAGVALTIYGDADIIRPSPSQSLSAPQEERLLFGHLGSVLHGNGLGNFLFEMISFLGISKALGRTPAFDVTEERYIKRLINRQRENFPHLFDTIVIRNANHSVFIKHINPGSAKVTDFEKTYGTEYKDVPRIATYLQMMQSFKHFENLSRKEILSILQFRPEHIEIATNNILPHNKLKDTHNICVHMRRGDFTNAPMEMSKEESTIAGLKFVHKIVSKKYDKVNAVLLGSNPKYRQKIVDEGKFKFPVHIGNSSRFWPHNIDWVFSSLYCDTVFLTAAASTYGWWLSYFARGRNTNQTAYYLDVMFKRPDLEKQRTTRHTFFLPYFTPLHYNKETNTIDFGVRTHARK